MSHHEETLTVSPQMRERMQRLRAGSAGKADCIPVTAQISHHAAGLLGESTNRFYSDAYTFLKCELHAAEMYELDSVATNFDLYNIEAEALGAPFKWIEGQTPEVDPTRRLLRQASDWKKLKPIRMGHAGRMGFILEMNQRLMDMGLSPKVRFCGPVTLASKLMGLEELVVACLTEPEAVHELMTFLTDEVIAPWIICQREHCTSNETAGGADANASPPIMTVPLIREFCQRYIHRLEDTVGKVRLAALWGESFLADPSELLEIKCDVFPGMLQALDPDASQLGMGIYRACADRHDAVLVAGLDAGLLETGPIGEIEARVQRFITEGAGDGRFCLFLNDVAYRTPPAHVHAAVAIAHNARI
jgi:uroporphyrinogen-III decarboxylase